MLRQVGLACFIATATGSSSHAHLLHNVSQNCREAPLEGCPKIAFGAGSQALAFRNRAGADIVGLAEEMRRFVRSEAGVVVGYANKLPVRNDSPKNKTILPIVDEENLGDARRGAAYAKESCSTCHNVSASDAASPNPQAPSFKKVANTPGMTVTALTVWSRTSHPTMPNFIIDAKDMDDLIAYILSLRNEM